jgi:hypothetical protein
MYLKDSSSLSCDSEEEDEDDPCALNSFFKHLHRLYHLSGLAQRTFHIISSAYYQLESLLSSMKKENDTGMEEDEFYEEIYYFGSPEYWE